MKKILLLWSILLCGWNANAANNLVSGGPLANPEAFTASYDTLNLNGLLQTENSYFELSTSMPVAFKANINYTIPPVTFDYFYQYVDWGGGYMGSSWANFTFSNVVDKTTPGFANQYAAITGGGTDGEGSTYMVAYLDTYSLPEFKISLVDNEEKHIVGGYFTNSTYTYLTMQDGGGGGAAFKAGDWFLLQITGFKSDGSETTNSVSLYLADFRDGKSIILDQWQWVDLSSLGNVAGLKFELSSSDTGNWGMNTPAYFCLDKLFVTNDLSSINQTKQDNPLLVIPSEIKGIFTASVPENTKSVFVYDIFGNLLRNILVEASSATIDLRTYPANMYVIKAENKTTKVINK